MRDELYLGDGLYAGHDGYQIWLWTDRDGMRHEVALELAVYRALMAYVERLHHAGAI